MKVTQLCPTLYDPMDYTVHGILQARILEWVAFPFSRGSSQPRDQIQVSHIAGAFFTSWATREAQTPWDHPQISFQMLDKISSGTEGSLHWIASTFPMKLSEKPFGFPWSQGKGSDSLKRTEVGVESDYFQGYHGLHPRTQYCLCSAGTQI